MEINKIPLQKQIHDSTHTSFTTPSLFKDVKTLFNKAIENSLSSSSRNKFSPERVCRGFKKILDPFIPR